jgi:glycosyltransferase involved in cell wall biosynthesis
MENNKNPLVSVIMPVYNGEEYLAEAVQSILDQTYTNFELLIVDDGSSDNTLAIAKELSKKDHRVRVLRNKINLKIVGTLNRAIDESKGKYIARMDADDYKYPEAIEKQVAYLESNPDVAVVGGAIEVCGPHMEVLNHRAYPESDAEVRAKIFRYNPFAHPAVMMNANLVGDERYALNWAEDYDMWFRLGKKGKFANLPETVLKLRTHPDSVSQSKLAYQEKLTLYIRLKAIFEYGYTMSAGDRAYFVAQVMGTKLIPAKVKFKLFGFLRGGKPKSNE